MRDKYYGVKMKNQHCSRYPRILKTTVPGDATEEDCKPWAELTQEKLSATASSNGDKGATSALVLPFLTSTLKITSYSLIKTKYTKTQ